LTFYKITLNENCGSSRICIYNSGCNFKCVGCAYKINPAEMAESCAKALDESRIIGILASLRPKRVHFLGGEPTSNPALSRIAKFAHEELGAVTKIGHSNGSIRMPDYIDEASISIKAYDERAHFAYTGTTNKSVLANFRDAYERGIRLEASTVLIPEIVTTDEVERIAEFVASIDPEIGFHITAYIPVPGITLKPPTPQELSIAVRDAKKHLKKVNFRQLTIEGRAELKKTDPSFCSVQIA